MYSPKIVQHNLKRAEAIIRRDHSLPERWRLEPSSLTQIAEMRHHLASTLDDKGQPTRDLTREERLWVLCETTCCKLSFEHYYLNYVFIEDWSSRVAPFRPNRAQRLILRKMERQEAGGLAQMYQFLKARQLGVTTLFQILLSHRAFFYRNLTVPTGSAEPDKSRAMVQKLQFIWDNLPWWLRPRRTAYRAGELLEYGDLNSRVTVHWGNQKQGIARGSTSTVTHLSELASFVDPELLVDAALLRTLHENPFTLVALESTAERIGDWWNTTWDYNERMEAKGLARLTPIFLPWAIGTDLYPTSGWLKRRPLPEDWKEPDYIEKHAQACETHIASHPLLREEMGEGWKMSREQKWFYYLEYEEARAKNTLYIWLREMPATPEQAFQNANPIVFSVETLDQARSLSQAARPLGAYQLGGAKVSEVYLPGRQIGEALAVRCAGADDRLIEQFSLQPLEVEGWPDHDPELRLYVWEWPFPGEEYGVYCDPSEGVGEDNSVVGVIKKATPWHPDEQVAEWASSKVAPHDLWMWLFALSHIYTTRKPQGGWVTPRCVIETNIAAGDAAQTEMLKRGWSNFHQGSDLTLVGMVGSQAQMTRKPRAVQDRIGWRTTRSTRPKLISMFRKAVRDQLFVSRSPWLVKEMATLEYNLDRQRIEASKGNHDDRVVGVAIMLTSWYDPEVYGTVPTAWKAAREWEADLDQAPPYMGDKIFGRSVGRPPIGAGTLVDSRGFEIQKEFERG